MNETIQYWHSRVLATDTAGPLDTFRVPDEFCFRIRAVEFRFQSFLSAGDSRAHVGLSKRQADVAIPNERTFIAYQKFLAFASIDSELTGTAGASALRLSHRVELWDYDYRLVMKPTVMTHSNGVATDVTVGVLGELVPCTKGQRNAIIAWQGGPGA